MPASHMCYCSLFTFLLSVCWRCQWYCLTLLPLPSDRQMAWGLDWTPSHFPTYPSTACLSTYLNIHSTTHPTSHLLSWLSMYYLLYPATYLPVSLPTYLPNACLPASFLRDLLGLLILMFICKYLLIFHCFFKGRRSRKKTFHHGSPLWDLER